MVGPGHLPPGVFRVPRQRPLLQQQRFDDGRRHRRRSRRRHRGDANDDDDQRQQVVGDRIPRRQAGLRRHVDAGLQPAAVADDHGVGGGGDHNDDGPARRRPPRTTGVHRRPVRRRRSVVPAGRAVGSFRRAAGRVRGPTRDGQRERRHRRPVRRRRRQSGDVFGSR